MTDVRRYTDLRIAQSSRVHARLIERFIEVTEAELASQTDTFVRESLEDLLTRCAMTVAATVPWGE